MITIHKLFDNSELYYYMPLDAVSLVWLFLLRKTRWHTFFYAQYLYFLPTVDSRLHLLMLWKWLDHLLGMVINTSIKIVSFLNWRYFERIIKDLWLVFILILSFQLE